MTPSTIPNLSFEIPPGTGPSFLSGNAEPYNLLNGSVLQFIVDGVTEQAVFTTSDFADITAATADEVAAVITTQANQIVAGNDGGSVRINAEAVLEDVTIQITGGDANAALGFALATATGLFREGGEPDTWATTSDIDTVTKFAGFIGELSIERPEEIFYGPAWAVLAVILPTTYADAQFDFPTTSFAELFRGETWAGSGLVTSPALVTASFGVFVFEDFDTGWGVPTYFVFVNGTLVDASINGVVGDPEDFETNWGQGAAAISVVADFANSTKTADDFEGVVDTTQIVTVNSNPAGDYTVTINGNAFLYTSPGAETTGAIALAVANTITNNSALASATAVGNIISIKPRVTGTELLVTTTAPTVGAVTLYDAIDFPLLADNWIGQDNNPYPF